MLKAIKLHKATFDNIVRSLDKTAAIKQAGKIGNNCVYCYGPLPHYNEVIRADMTPSGIVYSIRVLPIYEAKVRKHYGVYESLPVKA